MLRTGQQKSSLTSPAYAGAQSS